MTLLLYLTSLGNRCIVGHRMVELVQNLQTRLPTFRPHPSTTKDVHSHQTMLLKALLFFPFNTLFRNSGWLPASERIPLAFTECTFQSEPHRLFQLLSRFPSAYCHSCQTSVSIAPRQTHNHTHPFSQGRSLLLAHPDFANLTSVVREASFAYLTPD